MTARATAFRSTMLQGAAQAVPDALGGDGIDILVGTSGDDVLQGFGGNDTLSGGLGDDVLDGGDGRDLASYRDIAAPLTIDLRLAGTAQDTGGAGHDTLIGIENVTGGTGNDTITGDGGANILSGNAGDDWLFGGEGDDILDGGAGNDALIGGNGTDTVTYASATGGVSVVMWLRGFQPTGGAGSDVHSSIEIFVGSRFDDSFISNDFDHVLKGGAGNDGLYGQGGSDTLLGGLGDDWLDGGFGIDTVSYADVAAGVTVDLARFDRQDTGGAGADMLVDLENLVGGGGNDTLYGAKYTNVIHGGAGNDTIYGRGGIDYLTGGEGDDVLVGGADRDRMAGKEGADIFRLETLADSGVGWRRDVIADFDGAAGDRIDLSLLDADTVHDGRQGFQFLPGMTGFGGGLGELRYRHEGDLTIVMGDVNGDAVADFEIELVGTLTLQARDFMF
ncbi:MAG: M10 family metallopeptidase C-terminal domain-containing protein [Alphaproteobacteria bacterium]|nr:M10 family metallopeptidase C-terminal domain-containing protein [Alphaproteobacteria bacterium]